jgi:hypothetical protein
MVVEGADDEPRRGGSQPVGITPRLGGCARELRSSGRRDPPALRNSIPEGLPHSPWQLVDHLRRTQHDILDFCVNPQYVEPAWPADYWPASAAPAADEWDASIRAFRDDRERLQALARDPNIDLTATLPHGSGQTCLRELVLAADHAAYHVGQLVLVRRALGIWR